LSLNDRPADVSKTRVINAVVTIAFKMPGWTSSPKTITASLKIFEYYCPQLPAHLKIVKFANNNNSPVTVSGFNVLNAQTDRDARCSGSKNEIWLDT